MQDRPNPSYQEKKAFFSRLLTIYGRKPVLEALQDKRIGVFRLHMAESNKRDGIVEQLCTLAERRGIEIAWHDRKSLSRISKNGKQDQGVAADLELDAYRAITDLDIQTLPKGSRLVALDGVSNPQNLGMIIRSVAASGITGLILPQKGCAALSPLVIKASAGTLFKTPIYHCERLIPALETLKHQGARVVGLSSHASESIFDYDAEEISVFILGNETEGVSKAVTAVCDTNLAIPMANGVESLNVAVTAALLAFSGQFRR